MRQETMITYEMKQASEMIKQSKYMKSINKVSVAMAKYENTIAMHNINEAKEILNQIIEMIVKGN